MDMIPLLIVVLTSWPLLLEGFGVDITFFQFVIVSLLLFIIGLSVWALNPKRRSPLVGECDRILADLKSGRIKIAPGPHVKDAKIASGTIKNVGIARLKDKNA